MIYTYNSYIVNNSYDLHINSYTLNNRYSLHF